KADLVGDVSGLLFNDPELPEAKALVALEVWRLSKEDPLVRATADDFKDGPAPASVQLLLKALDNSPAPTDLTDQGVLVAAGLAALRDDPKAVGLAKRAARPEGRLRALLQVAEWAADPSEALAAAAAVVTAGGKAPSGG